MSTNEPLVSVIVTTKNSATFLQACLQSIAEQTYPHIELIVVDNSSTDTTQDIARTFTSHVYTIGPERSAQRNFGASESRGDYVLIIDSDMVLTPKVVESSVRSAQSSADIAGVIIPEESFGEGFWAKCKQLEKSFYVGVDWIEAARFFRRDAFMAAGGYDVGLVSGEDWDLSNRVAAKGKLARTQELIRHNEGRLQLFKTLYKKVYYARQFTSYTQKEKPAATVSTNPYAIVLKRFGLYFRQPGKLLRNPFVGAGMLFMKVCEFGVGAMAFISSKFKQPASE